jgi:FkbM family methyltransferase
MRLLRKVVRYLRQAGYTLDGLFLDVGANIGTTTLTALRLGFSRAVAVEPEPTSASLIAGSAALNGLADRVQVVEAAAGAIDGEARLALHPTKSTSHAISDIGAPVRCVRLDSLHLDAVSLLWIDAEGSEGQVLQGAQQLLVARPPIVLEFAPGWLRAKNGLDTVLETAARYSAVVHPARHHPLSIDDLAASMDGDDRTDLLLVP